MCPCNQSLSGFGRGVTKELYLRSFDVSTNSIENEPNGFFRVTTVTVQRKGK